MPSFSPRSRRLGLVVGVWLWGQLAGGLFGRGWPPVGLGQTLGVLARLPARLDAPAQAWPARARAWLPGPLEFYGTLAMVVAVSASLGVAAMRNGAVTGLLRRGDGARWATPADVRALAVSRGDGARLGLGRHRGRLLRAEHRHALVAFGPPQSGKSAGLAIPALLEWDGPAVASSIKTDLLGATIAARRVRGRVFVFDPFQLAGVQAHTWSPLRQAPHVGWRTRGGMAPGRRRRSRPTGRRGRRLLGRRRRAATGPAPVRRGGRWRRN